MLRDDKNHSLEALLEKLHMRAHAKHRGIEQRTEAFVPGLILLFFLLAAGSLPTVVSNVRLGRDGRCL
jgi:hypothetical protein